MCAACQDGVPAPAFAARSGAKMLGARHIVNRVVLTPIGREFGGPPNPNKIPLPVAWYKHWTTSKGDSARVFQSTMGSGKDLESPGLRRLIVNAVYWGLGLESEIKAERSVSIVGKYAPLESGFKYPKLGVLPKPVSSYR